MIGRTPIDQVIDLSNYSLPHVRSAPETALNPSSDPDVITCQQIADHLKECPDVCGKIYNNNSMLYVIISALIILILLLIRYIFDLKK